MVFVVCSVLVCLVRVEMIGRSYTFLALNKMTPQPVSLRRTRGFSLGWFCCSGLSLVSRVVRLFQHISWGRLVNSGIWRRAFPSGPCRKLSKDSPCSRSCSWIFMPLCNFSSFWPGRSPCHSIKRIFLSQPGWWIIVSTEKERIRST